MKTILAHFFNSAIHTEEVANFSLRDCVLAVKAGIDRDVESVASRNDPIPLVHVFVQLCRCVSHLRGYEEPAKEILGEMALIVRARCPNLPPVGACPRDNSRRLYLSHLISSIESLPFGRGSVLIREIRILCNPGTGAREGQAENSV